MNLFYPIQIFTFHSEIKNPVHDATHTGNHHFSSLRMNPQLKVGFLLQFKTAVNSCTCSFRVLIVMLTTIARSKLARAHEFFAFLNLIDETDCKFWVKGGKIMT